MQSQFGSCYTWLSGSLPERLVCDPRSHKSQGQLREDPTLWTNEGRVGYTRRKRRETVPGAHPNDTQEREGGICRGRESAEEVLRQLEALIYRIGTHLIDRSGRRSRAGLSRLRKKRKMRSGGLVATLKPTQEQWSSLILMLVVHCMASHCGLLFKRSRSWLTAMFQFLTSSMA